MDDRGVSPFWPTLFNFRPFVFFFFYFIYFPCLLPLLPPGPSRRDDSTSIRSPRASAAGSSLTGSSTVRRFWTAQTGLPHGLPVRKKQRKVNQKARVCRLTKANWPLAHVAIYGFGHSTRPHPPGSTSEIFLSATALLGPLLLAPDTNGRTLVSR